MQIAEQKGNHIQITSINEDGWQKSVASRLANAYVSFKADNGRVPTIVEYFNHLKQYDVTAVPKFREGKFHGTTFAFGGIAFFGSQISPSLAGKNILSNPLFKYDETMNAELEKMSNSTIYTYLNGLTENKDVTAMFNNIVAGDGLKITFLTPVNHKNIVEDDGIKVGKHSYSAMPVSKTFKKQGDIFIKHNFDNVDEESGLDKASKYAGYSVKSPENLDELAKLIRDNSDKILISGNTVSNDDRLFNRRKETRVDIKNMSDVLIKIGETTQPINIPFARDDLTVKFNQKNHSSYAGYISAVKDWFVSNRADKFLEDVCKRIRAIEGVGKLTIENTVKEFMNKRDSIINYRVNMLAYAQCLPDKLRELAINGIELKLNTAGESPDIIPSKQKWAMIDIDKYELPEGFDANRNPEEAIKFWISKHMPEEYKDVGFYYHLSSSAGFIKSGEGYKFDLDASKNLLNAHFFIMFDKPIDHKILAMQLDHHARTNGLKVDTSVLKTPNQVHYIAPPHIQGGDPLPHRDGMAPGKLASLDFDPAVIQQASYNVSSSSSSNTMVPAFPVGHVKQEMRFNFLDAGEARKQALDALKRGLDKMGDDKDGFYAPWSKAIGAYVYKHITSNPHLPVPFDAEVNQVISDAVMNAYKRNRANAEWQVYLNYSKNADFVTNGETKIRRNNDIYPQSFENAKDINAFLRLCPECDFAELGIARDYMRFGYAVKDISGNTVFVTKDKKTIWCNGESKGSLKLDLGKVFNENSGLNKPAVTKTAFKMPPFNPFSNVKFINRKPDFP